MKIEKLRLKNLNSIYGGYEIDFTNDRFCSDGIFAIVGRTGAGKSTILDAITLALYGQTPRLGAVTGDRNDVISRGSNECLAEVEFSCKYGRFRASFSQKRSTRSGAKRSFSMYKQELINLDNGMIITAKPADYRRKIVEITGLNFEQFTKTMLLAQGRFNAFLGMNGEERAELLEELSGTEIYSEISRLTYERKKSEAEQLAAMEQNTRAINILSPEEERVLSEELNAVRAESENLTRQVNANQKIFAWLEELDNLERKLTMLDSAERELNERKELFMPDALRLERGCSARNLETKYVRISNIRHRIEATGKSLESSRIELAGAEKELTLQRKETAGTRMKYDELEAAWRQESELIARVRTLDREIAALLEQEKNWRDKLVGLDSELKDCDRELNNIQAATAEWRKKLTDAEKFLEKHISETDLTEKITQAKLFDSKFENAQNQLVVLERTQNELSLTIAARQREYEQLSREAETVAKQSAEFKLEIERSENALKNTLAGRLEREYENELEYLHKELLLTAKIVNFEAERKRLADNQPCPLCGAIHHPFADGNIPELEPVQQKIASLEAKITLIKECHRNIDKNQSELAVTGQKLNGIDSNIQRLENDIAVRKKEYNANIASIEKLKNGMKEITDNLFALSADIDMDIACPEQITTALMGLREQLFYQQECQKKYSSILVESNTRLAALTVLIEEKKRSRKSLVDSVQEVAAKLEEQRSLRSDLYGAKSPDAEAARFTAIMIDARERCENMAEAENKITERVNILTGRIRELERTLAEDIAELPRLEAEWSESLQSAGFNSEEDFSHCLLDNEEFELLSIRKADLDKTGLELKGQRKSVEASYRECVTQYSERPSKEEIAGKLQLERDALNRALAHSGALTQKLADNETAKVRFKNECEKLQNARDNFEKWRLLDELIGGSDAKKFRNFVQGLTFDLLIKHANRNLLRIAPRYLLQRAPDAILELNVIDSEQAGEIRTVKSLSGGETFLVSLALALGLSDMAGKNTRIDSLFLDEGFGSLDGETLDSALTALTVLAGENKLIGVISHVGGLQERLSTIISVIPVGSGRSRISGPGCRNFN